MRGIIPAIDSTNPPIENRGRCQKPADFNFALVYIENLDLFYIFPIDIFISYGSEIHLVEAEKRQRKPRSAQYRNAWELILQASVGKESCVRSPVKFPEAGF
ncbi:MAG: group I intron-associated PD-(D/E)XK endonuclease [Nostoc sp.]|uniref:group I intron-associated PD-(D/E)XK endonuclease n=1 Tax=Nostoc sp. TaxID=1180 RepID=UPI002FF783C2